MTSQSPATSKKSSQHPRNFRYHNRIKPCHLVAFSFAVVALLLGTMPTIIGAFDLNTELKLTPTQYSEYNLRNGTYLSSTEYNARGMQPLYDIANTIVMALTGEEPIPEGYIQTTNKMDLEYGPKVMNNEWIDLIKHYWAILLIVILLGILIVVMPIIGLCFCCCRCAGACGGRSEPFDKKHDTCRRVFLGFLLIILATGILFGVIAAFVTTVQIQAGVEGSTTAIEHGGADTRTFLATTADQVNQVLVLNYKQLSDQLKNILRETLPYIISQLERKSSAISLIYLTDFLSKLPDTREKLLEMRKITNELRVHASQLSDGLRGVKRDLLNMLNKCHNPACTDVLTKYEIGTLDENGIHYDQLPNVTGIIHNLETLINDNIASVGNRGHDVLNSIRTNLKEAIAKSKPKVIDAIDQAGDAFKKAASDVTVSLDRMSTAVGSKTDSLSEGVGNYIEVFNPYRYYTTIAVCSLLLMILFCLVLSLCCGICGKRPGGYGDDCCNKGAGSRFLMIAVTLIFLCISAIALVALLHFLLGVVTYRGICVPLSDPENDRIFAEIDSSIDLNELLYSSNPKSQTATGTLPPFRISHVIAACKSGQAIYEVLRIHNRIDIKEIRDYPAQYKINQTLENLVNSIDFDNRDFEILTPADKERILALGKSSLKDYSSGQFIDNLNETITKHSLTEIANQLRQTANKIIDPALKDVQVGLRNQALHLETYEQNLVIPMKKQASELITLAHELDGILRYKDHSFEDSIPLLVNEIEKAQNFMTEEGRPFVKATASNMTLYFSSEIDRYLNMVVNEVEKKIGLCKPMANVYDAGIVAGCKRLVNPINGFWLAVFWCVLLFIPTLIVAIKLAGLYQKSDPYPGPLVESEYLYDAYSERDHIPLANGPKNKRRKNKDRRRREYYEEAAVGPVAQQQPVAGPAGGRDTRYSDMAPKHWDGGPPRYQNPPMAPPASEYERPPPYYYPGASDQE